MSKYIEIAVAKHDWFALRSEEGAAEEVPGLLRRLFEADSVETARSAYLEAETAIVTQGMLFEAAPAVVEVSLAALASESMPHSRGLVIELVNQCVSGVSHPDEDELGSQDLGEASRAVAREAIWLFYAELATGRFTPTLAVLYSVETDRARLKSFVELYPPERFGYQRWVLDRL